MSSYVESPSTSVMSRFAKYAKTRDGMHICLVALHNHHLLFGLPHLMQEALQVVHADVTAEMLPRRYDL